MNRYLPILFAAFFSVFNLHAQDSKDYANSITIDELKDKLYTYSSDEFEGRETGKRGQKIAVEYLKDHYINNNIESLIKDTYYQTVPLKSIQEPEVSIIVNNKEFIKNEDYIILSEGKDNVNL